MYRVELAPHPDSSDTPVRGIGVSIQRNGRGLGLSYRIEAVTDRLRVPGESAPRIGQELWKHTCCECFLALADDSAYHEFNLSPSREWTAYAFTNYREGAPLTDETLDPRIAIRRCSDRMELDASIALDQLSPRYTRGELVIGLSAVIEDAGGRLSYWALRHPAGKPDFHHRDAFALTLPPP